MNELENITNEVINNVMMDDYFFRIPKSVFFSKTISTSAKLLYAFIFGISRTESCFATNEYLAEQMGVSVRNINLLLKELKENNLISIMTKGRSRYITPLVVLPVQLVSEKNIPDNSLSKEQAEFTSSKLDLKTKVKTNEYAEAYALRMNDELEEL